MLQVIFLPNKTIQQRLIETRRGHSSVTESYQEKYKLRVKEITTLREIISEDIIQINPKRVTAISNTSLLTRQERI